MKFLKRLIFNLAIKVIENTLRSDGQQLSPEYLLKRGWIEADGFYIEPTIKDRDRVSIRFEAHYYRVFHGANNVFVALESTIEWLEIHLMLLDKYSKRLSARA